MLAFPPDPFSPVDYRETTLDDSTVGGTGKLWRAHPNGMWHEYVEPVTGGSETYAELTDAATVDLPALNTPLASALSGKASSLGADDNYVTDAEKTKLTNLSGTNTGDETTSTIKTKLGITTLSGSNTGDQDITGLLSISTAASTYQTQAGMSSYLTTATAASTYAPISTTVTLTGAQTLTNKSISSGQITGLGALATSTDAANLTGSIAVARIATALTTPGPIGGTTPAAISATTVTASGAVSALRHNAATYGDVNGAAFTSGFGVVRYTGGGTNRFYFGSSDDTTIRRSSAGVLDIDSGTNDAFRDLRLRNLTASGTVTAAQYLYTTALFVTESTTARTLTSADHGKTIVCTNASAVAITLNTGLPTCFFVTIIQKGTGQVTVSGTATLEVFTGFAAKTAGQHAQMSVSNYGTSNVYHVAGQLGT